MIEKINSSLINIQSISETIINLVIIFDIFVVGLKKKYFKIQKSNEYHSTSNNLETVSAKGTKNYKNHIFYSFYFCRYD